MEREALAIIWSCEHFHLDLYGAEFNMITSLELIFNNPKSKPPPWIERWVLRLQPYKYKVEQSRAKQRRQIRLTICLATYSNSTQMMLTKKYTTAKDCLLQHIIYITHTGQWHTFYDHFTTERDYSDLKSFYNVREELTVLDDRSVLLRRHCIVIPRPCNRALELAHEGQQGLVKTKQLLKWKTLVSRNRKANISMHSLSSLNCSQQTTGTSPAELLFGRPINIKLPALRSLVTNDTLCRSDSWWRWK